MKEIEMTELERWKLALRIMKCETEEQLDEIINSYHIEEEEGQEDGK